MDRTDDIDIISKNFVTYYGELYKHKKVRKATLAKLIENLTLKLTPEDEALLEGEILEEEMLRVLFPGPCLQHLLTKDHKTICNKKVD